MKKNKMKTSKHLCPTKYSILKDTLVVVHEAGGSATKKDILSRLAQKFNLSKAALKEMHNNSPSKTEFNYQVDWACSCMKKIGMFSQEGRGASAVFALTEIGTRSAIDKSVTTKTLAAMANKKWSVEQKAGGSLAAGGSAGFSEDSDALAVSVVSIIRDLRLAKQVILTGAPGTGKTRLARDVARAMTGDETGGRRWAFCQFHPSYDYTDFVEGLRPVAKSGLEISFVRQDGVFKEFCKNAIVGPRADFDAAFSAFADKVAKKYSSSKPLVLKTPVDKKSFRVCINSAGNVTVATGNKKSANFSVTKESLYHDWLGDGEGRNSSYTGGILEYLHAKFQLPKTENCNYVFIIDEINRGDISKIFGELFYAIDAGYRGDDGRVQTQYQNLIDANGNDVFKAGFYVPHNVYIIGTMNDVDRGVESMDFAIRRRFMWREILPETRASKIFGELDKAVRDEAANRMRRLNGVIRNGDVGLGAAYCIGPAYFLALNELGNSFDKLWKFHISPLLNEYLRGLPEAASKMERLSAAYYGS